MASPREGRGLMRFGREVHGGAELADARPEAHGGRAGVARSRTPPGMLVISCLPDGSTPRLTDQRSQCFKQAQRPQAGFLLWRVRFAPSGPCLPPSQPHTHGVAA